MKRNNKRVLELRTLPTLLEQRNNLVDEMESLIGKTKEETRAFTDAEVKRYDEIKSEIANLDKTIQAEEETRDLEKKEEKQAEVREAKDIFSDFIKGETRAVGEMDTTADGSIIPTELSGDIVKKVSEISGLFNAVRKVNSTGKYQQIVENGKASAGWTDELAEVTATDGDYELVEIGHHKLGALTKISEELVNQANFNVTSEVIDQISRSFAEKSEEAFIKGTGVKQPTGLVSSGVKVDLASKTAITTDEIVDIFHSIKAPYVANAVFLMNRNTLASIRKLKGTDGQYMFQEDMTKSYIGFVLGKPVIVSEYMDDFGVSANPIIFGDLRNSYIANTNPTQTIRILREKYATQGALGVLGFLFVDGKPVNSEAYAVATCPAV